MLLKTKNIHSAIINVNLITCITNSTGGGCDIRVGEHRSFHDDRSDEQVKAFIEFDYNTMFNDSNVPAQWDAVEVHPVIQLEDGVCEVCEPKDASFYSVYLHNVGGGIQCIADLPTELLANQLAVLISASSRNYRQP